uniref:hypothetical protein n=1 Tax=uncultured Allobacillus sp. TaxID=1638025 RepID=UPI002597B210|nr:hypothetical protein [uncultured Allobacillus sp.]
MMRILLLIFSSILLTGCLYPNNQLTENQATNDEQLDSVQQAVDEYRETTNGLLPIETKDQNTPIFIKYPIDFQVLREKGIMGEVPSNSFAGGGKYSYVLINPEEDPKVKVVDARITQQLRTVNYQINLYRNENDFAPFGERIGNGIFSIDREKLRLKDGYTVISPYTGQALDIVIGKGGDAKVDFRPDVYQLMEEEGIEDYEGDLRYLLAEHYPIVPAFSPAMIMEDGEIILKQSE